MTALPDLDYLTGGDDRSAGDFLSNILEKFLGAAEESPGGAAETDLSILSGVITPTRAVHRVDTQGATASDDLTTAAISTHTEGRWLLLKSVDNSRVVTIKHAVAGDGGFYMTDSADFVLSSTARRIVFERVGNVWVEILRNYGTAAGWRTGIDAAATVHTHAQSDVTGLVAALAGKASSSHTHAQSDITGLVAALAAKASIDAAVQVGTVIDWPGATAPSKWVFIYGQAISRTTYAAAFSVCSTTHGAGDGVTTFNLPDGRGRVVAGKDNMGGSAANRLTSGASGVAGTTLGANGGSETHTLDVTQIPPHTHGLDSDNAQAAGIFPRAQGPGTDFQTGSTGGGAAHPNVQPTLVLNKIMYLGV